MHKRNTRCPPQLTAVSAQALDDITLITIFMSMQESPSHRRVMTAIYLVFEGMHHFSQIINNLRLIMEYRKGKISFAYDADYPSIIYITD